LLQILSVVVTVIAKYRLKFAHKAFEAVYSLGRYVCVCLYAGRVGKLTTAMRQPYQDKSLTSL